MDRAFYSTIIREMHEAGVEELGMFYLGESFLLPWLHEAIKEAKDVGYKYVFITTNGSASTPNKVRECMAAGLNSLKFSLNFADEKQFADITNVPESGFNKIIANVKEAFFIRERNEYDCGLFASYISYDDEQGKRMAELVEELKPYLDEIYALPLYSQADLTGGDNEASGMDVKAGNPGRAGNMRPPLPCWSLFTEGRVSYDGHLSACCFDHDGRFRMGDLNEVDFMDAWHSPEFINLREAHLQTDVEGTACQGCVAYD